MTEPIYSELWVPLDNHRTPTFAMEVPTGVIVRHSPYTDNSSMVFVPGVRIEVTQSETRLVQLRRPCTCNFVACDLNCPTHGHI